MPSQDADGDLAVDLALELIGRILAAADGRVLGIGIGAPGLIDTSTGTVIRAVKRDWRDLALGEMVARRFAVPVHVANDSQAAALAEYVFGAVRGRNLITVKVGEGIGAGLVLNGTLFEGDGFGAGEIGHTVIDPAGDLCRCERRGCLETVASARAVFARLRGILGAGVSPEDAVAAFEARNGQVEAVVLDAGRQLGYALAGLIGALHVRRIILAGTMAAFGERWLEAVHEAAASRALAALADDTTFELGPIDDVIVLGASALLMTRELGLSLRPIRQRRPRSPEAAHDESPAAVQPRALPGLAGMPAGGGGVAS